MHFVTGGAFNGKSKWVKQYYQLREIPHLWFSSYQEVVIPENFSNEENVVVLEGIEAWLKLWIEQLSMKEAREKWQLLLRTWLDWEQEEANRKVILIGSDITKGIVPMLYEDRKWRDLAGWAYQDAAKVAERVELIWYGISQRIK